MIFSAIAGVVGIDMLAEELKDPAKKAFGWVFSKGKDKYDEHKLNQSLANLSDKITKVTKVKTIYKGDDSIDLHEFYVPTKIEQIDSNINCVEDISDRAIVLEGTVGQGKSIFMRFLTYQEAKQGQRIPLFFELRRLEDKQTLTNALSRQISNWIAEFEESDFDTVAKTGKLVLFLDGFDEVPHNRVKSLLNETEGWCERYPNMQVVISSRPEADIQRSNYFKVFKLSEYRFYEQSLLIDKLVEETESKELLKQAIKDSDTEIQELLKTPLMVTLFVMNYRGNLEIPSNQYEFYKDLFSVLISRHDKTKPGFQRELNSNLSKKELQEVFEQFCFISLNKDKLVFSHADAIEIIEKCLDKQGLQSDSDKVLADFSKVVCLLLKDGMEYTFVHKSIPEYFYACYIAGKSDLAKQKFYKNILKGNRDFLHYRIEIFNFLENIDTYCFYRYMRLILLQESIDLCQSFPNIIYYTVIMDDESYNLLMKKDFLKSRTFRNIQIITININIISGNIHSKCVTNTTEFEVLSNYNYHLYSYDDIKEKISHIQDKIHLREKFLDKESIEKIKFSSAQATENLKREKNDIQDYLVKYDEIDYELLDF